MYQVWLAMEFQNQQWEDFFNHQIEDIVQHRNIKVSLMLELEQNLIIFVDTIPITIIPIVERNNAANSVLCLSQMLAY